MGETGDGYATFRGRCKELSETACAEDPSLTLVRGHYWCPFWNRAEQHWWTVDPNGKIHDPSAGQFPSNGEGKYIPFDGIIPCSECGEEMSEDEAHVDGRFAFCSYECHGRFIGVLP